MTLAKIRNVNRSLKSFAFAALFFILTNYHGMKAALNITALRYSLVPFIILTDIFDLVLDSISYGKTYNKNIGTTFNFIIVVFRISLGVIGGAMLNFGFGTPIATVGPYLILSSVLLGSIVNFIQFGIHLWVNRKLKDKQIKEHAQNEFIAGSVFLFLSVMGCSLFFSPAGALPGMAAAWMLVGFMLSTSLFFLVALFQGEPKFTPSKPHKNKDVDVPQYYKTFGADEQAALKTEQGLQDKLAEKKRVLNDKLDQVSGIEKMLIAKTLQDKIDLLESMQTILESDAHPKEKLIQMTEAKKSSGKAFSSPMKFVSQTEGIYRAARSQLKAQVKAERLSLDKAPPLTAPATLQPKSNPAIKLPTRPLHENGTPPHPVRGAFFVSPEALPQALDSSVHRSDAFEVRQEDTARQVHTH